MVEPPPKRPLYYAQAELRYLPRWTRNAIKYLGDYIDLLVKAMAFEFTKDQRCKESSLGVNIRRLNSKKHSISQARVDRIAKYNSFLYLPGKHDFSIPAGRSHRFTCKEVVLTVFITMKLAEDIKKISNFAFEVCTKKVIIKNFVGKTPR